MPSADKTAKQITKIILSASDKLTESAKAEQSLVLKNVIRWLSQGGKYQLDLNPDDTIRQTGKNFTQINKLADELGKPASLNRIKQSAGQWGRTTHQILNANISYAKSEFGDLYKGAASYRVPGVVIRNRVAQNLRPEPYLAAFRDPIRDTVTEFTQNGRDFFSLVNRLREQVAGIMTQDPDGTSVQRGLLENYYQAKRITATRCGARFSTTTNSQCCGRL